MWLHCIRHGETSLNASGIFSGWGDEGLTKMCASRLASVDFDATEHDAVYCSPAFRCKETARCLRLPSYIEEPRIVERHFGVFDGLSVSEVQEKYPEELAAFRRLDADFTIPGGESRAEHFRRVEEWLLEISRKHRQVLAVTHGGTIDFLYRLGTNGVLHGGEMVYAGPNAGLSIFEVSWPDVRVLEHGLPLLG